MKYIKHLFIGIFLLVIMISCSSNEEVTTEETYIEPEKTELFISAAASLTDAMDEIKVLYEEENNVSLTFNFAGSGKLAQQIQQGAPVDVFISANENWMNTLVEEDLIFEDTRLDVTGNELVLIVGRDSSLEYDSFEKVAGNDVMQIAIGNPESVPAGEYTESVLSALNKWDELEEKFVFAQDVRQVLTYVETGNVEIGFVYRSDAISSEEVNIIAASDPSMHDAIIYPGAVTADSNNKDHGKQFLDFVISVAGQEILEKHGFTK